MAIDPQRAKLTRYLDFVSLYTTVHKEKLEARKEANQIWKEKIQASDSESDYLEQLALLTVRKQQQALVGVTEEEEESDEEETTGADFVIQGAECSAQVVGDWDDWRPTWLNFTDGVWETKVDLEPGVYRYKFVVDGEWIHDPTKETEEDEKGHINNVVVVEDRSRVGRKIKEVEDQIKECRRTLKQPWQCESYNYKLCPKY